MMDFRAAFSTPYKPYGSVYTTSPYRYDGLASTPERPIFLSPSIHLQSAKPSYNTSPCFTGFQSPLNFSPSYLSPLHQQQPLDLSNSAEKLKPNRTSAFSSPNDSFYLQRLKSNPMFQDLQNLLKQECLHMQVPTNLINTSWNTTPVKVSGDIDDGATVYSLHLKLQERLLTLRTDSAMTSKALELEANYSCDVGKIEVSRYQGLCSAGTSDSARLKVNSDCDEKRLALIREMHKNIDRLVKGPCINDSGLCAVSSPASRCSSRSGSDRCTPDIPSHDSGILSDDSLPEFPTDKSTSAQVSTENPLINASAEVPAMRHLNFDKQTICNETSSSLGSDCVTGVISPSISKHCKDGTNTIVCTQDIELQNSEQHFRDVKQLANNFSEPLKENLNLQNVEQEEEISTTENGSKKRETKNRLLTPEATVILTNWYDAHIRYPYPSDLEVKQLSNNCGLSEKQVKKWMANKRVRCFNTLSISGNQHPIKLKYKGKRKHQESENSCPNYQQLTNEARDMLTQWYEEHSYNPYPSEEEKEELADKCGISISQVRSWFANKRSRANNTRKQIPNYFIEKFPEYTPHVHMVSIQREQARRKTKKHESHMEFFYQNNHYYM